MSVFKTNREEPIVGLDIGSSRIRVVVATAENEGLEIIGVGSSTCKGLRKGAVTSIDSLAKSVKSAVEEAELMSECRIENVHAGIGGKYINGFNSHGVIILDDGVVRQGDVERVIEEACRPVNSKGTEIIRVIPQMFILDSLSCICDPIELSGHRLEVKVHVMTSTVAAIHDIGKSVNRAGFRISALMPGQLASAEATLDADEKKLGIIYIDIGAATTGIAIYIGDRLIHTSTVLLGGNIITNDIAIVLKTSIGEAERLKREYGCAMTLMINRDETVEFISIGNQKTISTSRHFLGEIIEARVEDIFAHYRNEVSKSGHGGFICAGLVLAGGAVLLEGMKDVAEKVFEMPTKIGIPEGITDFTDIENDPMYATAVGLVCLGKKDRGRGQSLNGREVMNLRRKTKEKVREWFTEFF